MSTRERIAIVGFAGLFPGSADLAGFWVNVVGRADTAREPPPGRWLLDPADCHDPAPGRPDKVYSTRACFLDRVPVDPEWGDRLDPAFHLVLHAGRRAWADARTDRLDRARVGVVLGQIALPTDKVSALARQVFGFGDAGERVDPLNRQVAGLPAALLAKDLGLGGGAYCLDAACASSLYAVKLAADELLAGRADAMLAGGLSRPDSMYTQMGFSQLRALSPSGRCSPFDAKGDGLIVGEGCGVFVLKRLSDALRDGDAVHAVIAGIGLSNDVEGNLLAPASEGQLRAMRAAYAEAGWSPSDVDLVECHATGTPLGDRTEFTSLRELWAETAWRPGQCVIGSVKSTVGHLLTAAGSAGLSKVLLALRHGVLPPTANFERPQPGIDLDDSPFRMPPAAEPWRPRADGVPRRAAVSAFGFGGINAHVLLEEWLPGDAVGTATPPPADVPVAVVGLDARFGDAATLQAFQERALSGTPGGKTIGELSVPADRFRIPPRELAELLPQQVLALQVAANALDDAGLTADAPAAVRERTGVFLGVALDPNTTNFHLRWWAVQSGGDADAVGPPLTADRTMGALASVAASRIARMFRLGGPSFALSSEGGSGVRAVEVAVRLLQAGTIDRAVAGAVDFAADPRAGGTGDGAAALVLKRLADAERDGDRVYAVIRDAGAGAGNAVRIDASEVVGDAGAAAGAASLVRAVLALHQQVLPGRPDGGDAPARQTAFWLTDAADGPARAAVAAEGFDGTVRHVLLEAYPAPAEDPRRLQPLGPRPEGLFAVEADDPAGLRAGLDALARLDGGDVEALARRWWRERPTDPSRRLAVALVARTADELRDQVAHARARLDGADANGAGGAVRDRVFFNPEPLGRAGQLAFVFPGSGNHFPGMGRDIGLAWPSVLRRQQAANATLRSQLAPRVFWADRRGPDPDARAAIFGQVSLGALTADVVQTCGVRPDAVLGLSLGESSGLFGLGAWPERDDMYRRMQASSLFTDDLAGPCRSARAALGIGPDEPFDWLTGVVACPADRVRAALEPGGRAWLLIELTPGECVVGGANGAVRELVARLGVRFLPLPSVSIAHCDLVRPVERPYRDLHLLTTTPPAGVRYYSGAWGRSYTLHRDSAADAILAMALGPIDFPRVVEAAYADGVRLFLEMGPGASTTRAIRTILGDRPHVARSVCASRESGVSLVLRAVANLIAERVPVDLAAVYGVEPRPVGVVPSEGGRRVTLPVGFAPKAPPRAKDPPPEPTAVRREVEVTRPREPVLMPLPAAATHDLPTPSSVALLDGMTAARGAVAGAHAAFLRLNAAAAGQFTRQTAFQARLLHRLLGENGDGANGHAPPSLPEPTIPSAPPPFLDTEQCFEFARGSVARVLGPAFAEADTFPTRVRLPDGPLMLVDRVLEVEGEPRSMTRGRVVTEHDVHDDRWYVENGVMPTCVTVEAGQADLFLSGYLGIDFVTRGLAVYRLLDAVVTFHRGLPRPGETVHYDIHIDRFFRQGDTWLFRFRFEGTVNGEPLLTMTDGCAGFFGDAELAAGKGIVHTALDRRPLPGKQPGDWRTPAPLDGLESYTAGQVERLRAGDLAGCFGPAFAGLPLADPLTLPGGMLRLLDRVTELDPAGGRFGLGRVRAEFDVRPDDWFLTCHFVDDMVMPGTLMYECCLHTLRVLLLRWGWVGEKADVVCEPVPGVASRLKCRGQVIRSTKTVTYEVSVKERGYRPEPYVIVDALMYADGKPVVEITDMSLRLSGLTREAVEALWPSPPAEHRGTPLFDRDKITAFAIGKPSEAFGDRYQVFDAERVIARLPGPPYQFLDRITRIDKCRPWELAAGGTVVAEYDVPPGEWYFDADRQDLMPFAVLLEVALQPCGWLAAYLGSALTSPTDLSFRNLGGSAVLHEPVGRDAGTLATTVTMTRVSTSAGMIIQHYDFAVRRGGRPVYDGSTYFGFFSKAALAQQVGIREAKPYAPPAGQGGPLDWPDAAPFPDRRWRMVDGIDLYLPDGGPHGRGFARGTKRVDPAEWFFRAHFYQDPVVPGSLGLESFQQLLKAVAARRWEAGPGTVWLSPAPGRKHAWQYRGQVVPADKLVTVQAEVKEIDDAAKTITADGWLSVDGRLIYGMTDFTLRAGS